MAQFSKIKPQGLFAAVLARHLSPTAPGMSPSPKTGGPVPLPSFGPDGQYIPPTEVPLGPLNRNQMMPQKPLTPAEKAELIKKLKAWGKQGVGKTLTF
jgi:hypothetical protein